MNEALKPTWHEARTAGRVRRHTDILRGVAHELSAAPTRQDRPATATEAQARFEAYLDQLKINTPRTGLGAATGAFIDDLIARYGRYGEHLFKCFDDPRIPATTNDFERFFGDSKRMLRQALGCGSTTNSVLTNLGSEALGAYQYARRSGPLLVVDVGDFSPMDFLDARTRLARHEEPMIKQRSLVRHLPNHLKQQRTVWLSGGRPTEPDA